MITIVVKLQFVKLKVIPSIIYDLIASIYSVKPVGKK